MGRGRELEPLEHVLRAAAGLRAGQVVQLSDELEVLEAGQVWVDRGELPCEADLRTKHLGVSDHVETHDLGPATIRLQQRGEDPNRRGLPGAVRAEHGKDRRALYADVDAAEREDVAEGLPQPLGPDRGTVPASPFGHRGQPTRASTEGRGGSPRSPARTAYTRQGPSRPGGRWRAACRCRT